MKQIINGNEYNLSKNVRNSEVHRASFNQLSKRIFNLDFEPWYQSGYWGDLYIPYTLSYNHTVVANVSVSPITFKWGNQRKRYVQLGTVMTEPEYRGKGLSRWLMNIVLEEWIKNCDAIFLFANDSVREFYPKFGFVEATQYQYYKSVSPVVNNVRRLDMSLDSDRQLLLDRYKLSNPFSAFSMEENPGLLMFYCLQFLKDNIFYIEQYEAVVIAETKDTNLLCYDIFCPMGVSMDAILSSVASANTESVVLGFTPKNIGDYQVSKLNEANTTLFLLGNKENLFNDNRLMFPLLSHT